jgi:hypothetical protein
MRRWPSLWNHQRQWWSRRYHSWKAGWTGAAVENGSRTYILDGQTEPLEELVAEARSRKSLASVTPSPTFRSA